MRCTAVATAAAASNAGAALAAVEAQRATAAPPATEAAAERGGRACREIAEIESEGVALALLLAGAAADASIGAAHGKARRRKAGRRAEEPKLSGSAQSLAWAIVPL